MTWQTGVEIMGVDHSTSNWCHQSYYPNKTHSHVYHFVSDQLSLCQWYMHRIALPSNTHNHDVITCNLPTGLKPNSFAYTSYPYTAHLLVNDGLSWQTVGQILCVLEGILHGRALHLQAQPHVDVVEVGTMLGHMQEEVDVLGAVLHLSEGR